MKKAVLAAGIALVLSFPSMAAEPSTLTDRADPVSYTHLDVYKRQS